MTSDQRPSLHVGVPIGQVIRQCRTEAGLTQRQLADAARVSVGVLRDIEQGRTSCPRWRVVEDLSRALGIGQRRRTEPPAASRPQPGEVPVTVAYRRDRADGSWPVLRISVLGSLMATRDGLPLALGSVRRRAVLGLLVMNQGSTVHRDAIVDALWGCKPPASAITQVQNYVSDLRCVLDPARGRGQRTGLIASSGRGYELTDDHAHTDLAAFRRLARLADEATADGDWPTAGRRYEEALRLWHAGPLADVDVLRQHPDVTALGDLWNETVLRFAEAGMRAGAFRQVLPHLRGLCQRDCFNEQAHAHLMIALAGAGQQSAALDVFTALRHRLDQELGIRPGAALTKAHVRVLQQLGTEQKLLVTG